MASCVCHPWNLPLDALMSIGRRLLHALNHDRIHNCFAGFKLQAELVLQSPEDRRVHFVARIIPESRNAEGDAISPHEASLVQYRALKMLREEVGQHTDRNILLIHGHHEVLFTRARRLQWLRRPVRE